MTRRWCPERLSADRVESLDREALAESDLEGRFAFYMTPAEMRELCSAWRTRREVGTIVRSFKRMLEMNL